jgi:UDP-N-acetylglucosamine--N-acetylmuramyl-(pentapeptide) pyrophosphoryl-undecaprenol N-acetylglucosamine transferase
MKVMIAAGGTGGHIVPAVSLADILMKEKPDTKIYFFGSSNRMEATVIPEAGYRFYGVQMTGMTSGVSAKLKSAYSLVKARRACQHLLELQKPDILVAFGNYISVPIVGEAKKMGIPVILHEQNSFAGKANRFLSGKADAIVCCYESNLEQFPKEKCRVYGNPAATLAAEAAFDKEEIRRIGLDPEKPFVVFMMGSLGSSSVSEVIDEACEMFDSTYQIVIAAGKDNDYEFKTKDTGRIKIVPFVNGRSMLKGCALAVTRAGATTMAEIGAIGTCSILIPSPNVANNHQVYNAKELADIGGAIMIEEKDLTAAKLAETVNWLMSDETERMRIRENARKAGKTDSFFIKLTLSEVSPKIYVQAYHRGIHQESSRQHVQY